MKKKSYLALSIIFLFLVEFPSFSQVEDIRIRRLNTQIEKLNKQYPQQKIYLQFNHPYYITTDKILIKAFVLNYSGFRPDTVSTNLYIEITDAKKGLNFITIVRLKNGVGVTQIDLKDTIQAGVYKFKAFTNWSRNFNDEFNYSKYVLIAPEGVTKEEIEAFKNFETAKSKIVEMNFFAEGGNFISGLKNKIAIRSNVNEFDDIKNMVLADRTGNKIRDIEFNDAGIATFYFIPEPGNSYLFNYEKDGKSKSEKLPEFKKSGYVLNVDIDYEKDKIYINLETNVEKTLDYYANSVFFLLQLGGEKLLLEKHILQDKKINFSFTLTNKPAGLLLLTVFDDDLILVAERLIFNNVKQKLPEINVSEKQINDTIQLILKTAGKFKTGQITISGRSYSDEIIDLFDTDILKYLWFNTYLTDFNFNDDVFHNRGNKAIFSKLDNLLITEKWQRYSWNNIINDQFPDIKYKREKYLVVSGKITRQLIKLPLENSPVHLTVLNEFYFNKKDTTDKNGRFYFDGIDLYDTIKIKLESKRYINEKDNVLIYVDEADFVAQGFDKSNALYSWYKNLFKAEKKKDKKKYFKTLSLNNTVLAEDDGRYRLYSKANYVINVEENLTYTSISDIIRGRVPGVNVTGDGTNARYTIRGPSSILGSNDPLYLVDGMQIDRFAFNNIPPEDVDKIEVLSGTQSAIYGIRGGNGVLAIYTKRGSFVTTGKIIFDMLGYQNIKDKKKIPAGRHFNKADANWFPFVSFNNSESYYYVKTKQNPYKEVLIEGILNGVPISEKVNVK